jgi:hypothetical protein
VLPSLDRVAGIETRPDPLAAALSGGREESHMPSRSLHLKCRECGRILAAVSAPGSSSIREHSEEHPGINVTYQLVLAETVEAEERQGDVREVAQQR